MSDDIVIRVENLGKSYSLRHQAGQRYTALRDPIAEKASDLAFSTYSKYSRYSCHA
jgi:hypothetical protein